MNYLQIQQFMVIAKHMSLTKAARELFITQPALSHSLAKMEEELGVRLFYRSGNKMVFTPEGESLLEHFRRIDEDYGRMYDSARQLSAAHEETIALGFSGSVMIFSSLFVTGFLTAYNGIPINKIFADHDKIERMLKDGQLDFAITYPPIKTPEIANHVIYEDAIVLAVSSGHPLVCRECQGYALRSFSLSELGGCFFTLLTRANPFRKNCDALLQKEGITISGREYDYADYIRVLEDSRHGDDFIAFTTENSFYKWYGDGFVCLPITGRALTQVTGVSWRTDSKVQYKYKELLDQIVSDYPAVYDNYWHHSFPLKDFNG